jgi:hypothetical protein
VGDEQAPAGSLLLLPLHRQHWLEQLPCKGGQGRRSPRGERHVGALSDVTSFFKGLNCNVWAGGTGLDMPLPCSFAGLAQRLCASVTRCCPSTLARLPLSRAVGR